MTTARIVRRLLLISAYAWGLPASAASSEATGLFASLSPEQRQEMREQVREHRQRQRDVRQDWRDGRGADERYDGRQDYGGRAPQQHLSPEDREEFRQWMRERHGRDGGRGNRGGRGDR